MKEILETVIKALVDNQEAVKINAVEGEKSVVYEVKVADEDMGKVIGKDGKIAIEKAAAPDNLEKVVEQLKQVSNE